jgi:hypothetical protein
VNGTSVGRNDATKRRFKKRQWKLMATYVKKREKARSCVEIILRACRRGKTSSKNREEKRLKQDGWMDIKK